MEMFYLSEEIVCRTNIDNDTENTATVKQKEILFSYDFGETAFKKISFSGVRLLYGKLRFKKPIPVKMQSSNPYIEMYFSFKGSRQMFFSQSNRRFCIPHGHQNLFYIPDPEFYIEPEANDEENISLQIQFNEGYFKRLIPINAPLFHNFATNLNNRRFAALNPTPAATTPKMLGILNDIVHCERTGIIKQLHLEANILKLLQYQFEQYEESVERKEYSFVKDYDIDKLFQAKKIIEQNITHPYPLLELAHKTGLNDYKLKKGFKELFGNTVFGYLHELRMQKAREMLFDSQMSIAEIAEYCGYAYIPSFIKAYKQKYGLTPKKMREN
ncbi:helix-turn-helix domain-containing protein [Flavobacterium sp. Sd200]|uniref:helix-turn-helix domain-containing protein n=1 Tax=Flavobacterium sp. Sd200 TaxID=2692211 RepID=UPI00136B5C89|nr:AraC family transcriptional regulator [Flavobacterium sp. Sd200]MXN92329.1 helix-turn-helix domain-containing protein [Flavobacterium sp. Sd200]